EIPYSQTLTPSGGTAPYTFTVSSGMLPLNLALDLNTGVISGNPVESGTFSFDVLVTDTNGCTATAPYFLIINCPDLAITTPSLSSGLVGTFYSQQLAASGDVTPYTWSVTDGTLPQGLSLDSSTGVISGTPELAGVFDFVITVTHIGEE